MANENNLKLYNQVRIVPEEAQKTIEGGRLKGMTDINPMWRIKTLTEQFGACGLGWFYNILDKRIVEGGNDEKVAFLDIELFVKFENEWSRPIQGTGGSSFVAKESKGLYTNDEAFKMALTDALGVAMKALGIGADVYWGRDANKYNNPSSPTEPPKKSQPSTTKLHCASCDDNIDQKVYDYSVKNHGQPLCRNCQKKPVDPDKKAISDGSLCSDAQVTLIERLIAEKGYTMQSIITYIENAYNKKDIKALTKKEAMELIDHLKSTGK